MCVCVCGGGQWIGGRAFRGNVKDIFFPGSLDKGNEKVHNTLVIFFFNFT